MPERKSERKTPAGGKSERVKVAPVVVHPELRSEVFVGDKAMTCQQAKELIGWLIDEEKAKALGFKEPDLVDEFGNKVWLTKNRCNRRFRRPRAMFYAQCHLNREWRFNFENIVVGKYGNTLSAQHRIGGLILAGQIWAGNQKEFWQARGWDREPTMECSVGYGVDESNDVLQTFDNTLPRTLDDVLHSFDDLFGEDEAPNKDQLIKVTVRAVAVLWERTGAGRNHFLSKRSHALAVDFINRHRRLLDAVRHVVKADKDGKVKQYVDLGVAAACLYLMGCSRTDGDAYKNPTELGELPSEVACDFKAWKRACQFWTALAAGDKGLDPLCHVPRPAVGDTGGPEDWSAVVLTEPKRGGGLEEEKVAALCKAWPAYASDEPLDAEALRLKYNIERNDDGTVATFFIDENPDFGGIDFGYQGFKSSEDMVNDAKEDEEVEDTGDDGDDPPPEVVRQRAERVRADRDKRGTSVSQGGENGKAETPGEGTPTNGIRAELLKMKEAHPGKILLYREGGGYVARMGDAGTAAKCLGVSLGKEVSGLLRLPIPPDKAEDYINRLLVGGHKVGLVNGDKVEDAKLAIAPSPAGPTDRHGKPLPTKVVKKTEPKGRKPGNSSR